MGSKPIIFPWHAKSRQVLNTANLEHPFPSTFIPCGSAGQALYKACISRHTVSPFLRGHFLDSAFGSPPPLQGAQCVPVAHNDSHNVKAHSASMPRTPPAPIFLSFHITFFHWLSCLFTFASLEAPLQSPSVQICSMQERISHSLERHFSDIVNFSSSLATSLTWGTH